MNLSGNKVVITGANGALGRVVADVARANGAQLVLLDITWPTDAPTDGATRSVVPHFQRDMTRSFYTCGLFISCS